MKLVLLSQPTANPKLAKNLKLGVLTAPLHLAPYNLSGFQVCPMASKGCAAACLNTAGRGRMTPTQEARKRKTLMYFQDRDNFLDQLVTDIQKLQARAKKLGLECGVRLNATSDLPVEKWKHNGIPIMTLFPDVQFYDYTSITKRAIAWAEGRMPANYHLTFSAKEDNDEAVKQVAEANGNIAVVFGDGLPDTYLGLPVIDGDEHDYRPVDPKGCVIGLKAKGDAKKDTTGFVKYVGGCNEKT